MRDAASSAKLDSLSAPPRTKKRILAVVFDALHHSRRLQAQRTLRHYHDLVDQAHHSIVEAERLRSGEPPPCSSRANVDARVYRKAGRF